MYTYELGGLILLAESAFYDYCEDNNIKIPDEERRRITRKYTKWIIDDDNNIKYMEITSENEYNEEDKRKMAQIEKDKKDFQEIKRNFLIDYILKNGTYEDVMEYCKINNISYEANNILNYSLLPCQDSTKQCSFDCPTYNDCQGRRK